MGMKTFNHIDLFSGIGGFALAARNVWGGAYRNVCFCEINKYCQAILKKNFGKDVVICDDIRKLKVGVVTNADCCGRVHGKSKKQSAKESHEAQRESVASVKSSVVHASNSNRAGIGTSEIDVNKNREKIGKERKLSLSEPCGCRIDLLTGGFPCQPFSQAGQRRGTEDDRFLWPEMLRVIQEFRPTWIIGENVAGLLSMAEPDGKPEVDSQTDLFGNRIDVHTKRGRGILYRIIGELEQIGYAVQTFVIPACAVGAPHRRDRVWIVANRNSENNSVRGFDEFRRNEVGREEKTAQQDNWAASNDSTRGHDHHDASDPRCEHGAGVEDTRKSARPVCGAQDAALSQRPVGDASDTKSRGDRRHEREESQEGEPSCGGSSWERNWLEVATRFCGVLNGLSDFLDRYFNEVTTEEDYGAAITKNGIKELRILREAIQSEEVWGKLGGWHTLEEKEVLLSLMLRIEERADGQDNLSHQGEEAQREGVRRLWLNAEFRRSPQRHEYQEQLAREYQNAVPQVSCVVAQAIAKTWDIVKCAYSSVEGLPGEMDGASLSKAGHRVERLKALGNAIVPQVAQEIMQAIKAIEDNQQPKEQCNVEENNPAF